MAYYVGENLRNEVCQEVSLSHAMAPTDAVVHSFLDSQKCSAFATELGSHAGWLALSATRFGCWRQKQLLAAMPAGSYLQKGENGLTNASKNGPIGNYVYAKNDASIKWLKHLVLRNHPEPYGPCAALFCHFWRDR